MKLNYSMKNLLEGSFKTLADKRKSFQLEVLDPNTLQTRQIPLSATAMMVKSEEWRNVQLQAEALVRSVKSLWTFLQKNLDPKNSNFFLKGLQEEEIQFSKADNFLKRPRSTMRVDYFYEDDGRLKILELNATIPTMQGYSDIAMRSMTEAMGLDYKNFRRNTEDLAETIQFNFEKASRRKLQSLLILTRKNDPQSFEMQYLQNTWKQLYGWNVLHGDAELVDTIPGKDQFLYFKTEYDACYRHIFFWRLKKNSALRRALMSEHRHHIFNPISSCLELKALTTLLSHVVRHEEVSKMVGIKNLDRDVLHDAFPDGSMLLREDSLMCFGKFASALYKSILPNWNEIETQPQNYVLKPNFGYGGQSVVIGSDFAREDVQEKVKRMMQIPSTSGKKSIEWVEMLDWLKKQDPFSWILQKRVSGKKEDLLVLGENQNVFQDSRYIDLNVFVSEREEVKAGGGVVRFSPNVIVNIAQGGGILPLLIENS